TSRVIRHTNVARLVGSTGERRAAVAPAPVARGERNRTSWTVIPREDSVSVIPLTLKNVMLVASYGLSAPVGQYRSAWLSQPCTIAGSRTSVAPSFINDRSCFSPQTG